MNPNDIATLWRSGPAVFFAVYAVLLTAYTLTQTVPCKFVDAEREREEKRLGASNTMADSLQRIYEVVVRLK